MKKLTKVSDYIWSRLNQITSSKHVFLLSGGGMMHLLDSLGKSTFKPIPMHHEQAASIAAYAYGRTINSLGICLVTSGPGATNALTGVAAAFTDSVPMIFISGQVSTLFSQRKKILDNWVFKNLILLIPLVQLRNIQSTLKIKMKLCMN